MERRVILAVVLTIGVIFLTNVMFPPAVPEPGRGGTAPASDTTADTTTTPGRAEAEPEPEAGAGIGERTPEPEPEFPVATGEQERLPEDTIRVETPLYRFRFSTRGGALIGAELSGHESYAPGDSKGAPVQLVREGDRLLEYTLAVGGDTVPLGDVEFTTDRRRIEVGAGERDSLVLAHRFPSGSVRFVVTYRFGGDSYLVESEGRLEGLPERGWSVLVSMGHGLRTNEKDPDDDYQQLAFVVNGRSGGIRSTRLDDVEVGAVRAAEGGPFHWVAVKNKYFLVALVAPEGSSGFGGLLATGLQREHAATLRASLPVPAGSRGFSFGAYLGPQEYERLDAIGRDLESVNPYGWRWLRPIIRPLVGLVMLVLTWMHETLALAYGWVLILFGVAMRVVLFPLYQKSMRAQMAQMQVQPLMKELQAKHKDDPQKLQQEILKLYKEHNVNPLAGCLPMLLPMPILFTLFFVFQGTIEFRGVPFLWLPDLSLKDPLYIIPLVMGGSMLLLQWIGQRGMEVNQQMKVMTWAMPVVFTVLFLNFPSGLNLYYATSNLASLPQQLYLSRERRAARRRVDERRKAREG